MKSMLSILLSLALMIVCGSSVGQGTTIEGVVDCGMWVKARKQDRAGFLEHWMLGLLNGMALGRSTEIWAAGGIRMSRDQAYLWMDRYCQSSPLSNVVTGAYALADERTNGAFSRAAR